MGVRGARADAAWAAGQGGIWGIQPTNERAKTRTASQGGKGKDGVNFALRRACRQAAAYCCRGAQRWVGASWPTARLAAAVLAGGRRSSGLGMGGLGQQQGGCLRKAARPAAAAMCASPPCPPAAAAAGAAGLSRGRSASRCCYQGRLGGCAVGARRLGGCSGWLHARRPGSLGRVLPALWGVPAAAQQQAGRGAQGRGLGQQRECANRRGRARFIDARPGGAAAAAARPLFCHPGAHVVSCVLALW